MRADRPSSTAARLAPDYPQAKFIELDHPATQRVKRAALDFPQNLSFIAADLAQTNLPDALRKILEDQKKSLFVIEGLLMYLTEAQIGTLFESLARLQRAGGRVVFTQMEPAPDGRSRFHNATVLVRGLLAIWREPFKSALPRERMAPFLKRFSYKFLHTAGAEDLRKQFLSRDTANLSLARGEVLFLAER